jgi:hypothetical protein
MGQRILLGLLVATVIAAGYPMVASERTFGGAGHPRSAQGTGPNAPARSRPFSGCPIARGARPYGIRCTPPVADLAVRVRLTPAQQLVAATMAGRAVSIVDSTRSGCTPNDHGGSLVQGGMECLPGSRPANPAEIRAALIGAGFVEVVARISVPGDPAPAGSVLYGLRVGDGCLVGYAGATAGRWIEGPLLDGRCVAP